MTSPDLPASKPPSKPALGLSARDRTVLVAGGLMLMGTIGLVLTSVRSTAAFGFWAAMFPLFGAAAAYEEIRRGRHAEPAVGGLVLRTVAHWAGPLLALWIVFLFLSRGQIDGQVAGLLALLVLALSCFFAGVHGAPALLGVAAFLAGGVVVAIVLEAYLLGFVVVAVLAGIGLAVFRWRTRSRD